jgi:hypothetical protein
MEVESEYSKAMKVIDSNRRVVPWRMGMREIRGVQITADLNRAQEWLLEHRPEYFSRLAGMHPERRFTLARRFRLLGEAEGSLRFAINAELRTFEEQDGQMVQSFNEMPEVVILHFEPADEGIITARASVAKETPVEELLVEWAERLLETCRQAFEEPPEEEASN